jgi:hypothetical protein
MYLIIDMPNKKKKKDTSITKEPLLEDKDYYPKDKEGIRHLIECNCILPQFSKRKKPIWHKFPVFSIVDSNNEIEEKFVQCDNCGIIHKVTEIGKSHITTKENIKSIRKIEEIKIGLLEDVIGLLEQYKSDISVWEEVEFIFENQRWGSHVVLSKEEIDGNMNGKILIINGPTLVKVKSFTRQELV